MFNRGVHPGPGKSARHFSCKCTQKMALVTCPYALFPLNFHTECAPRDLGPALFLSISTQTGSCGLGVWHFSWKFPYKMALVTCPCALRLRRFMCMLSYLLSYVCTPMFALICVLSSVCSSMCALIRALLFVLSCVLSFVCVLLCALKCVLS